MRIETTIAGEFYEFAKEVNIARPGAEIYMVVGREIVRRMSPEDALRLVRQGGLVYTPLKMDAYRLAARAVPKDVPVVEHPSHKPGFFPHWKAVLTDNTKIHVFFGHRNQNPQHRS